MNTHIEPRDVVEVVKSFLDCNARDESTTDLIIAIGCELLDVSPDKFMEMMEEN